MGKILTLGGNGLFSAGATAEFSVKAKTERAGPAGLGFDLTVNGSPEQICAMLYDAMSSYPEVAKLLLTVHYKFCADKGITPDKLMDHTHFKK